MKLEIIYKKYCEKMGVTPELLNSKSRRGQLVFLRHVFCYWARSSESFHRSLQTEFCHPLYLNIIL